MARADCAAPALRDRVTAAWMVGVLLYTGGDVRHPVFDTLFIVPLGCWVVALTVGRVIRRFR